MVVAKVVHGQKLFCFQTVICEIPQKLNCADTLNGGRGRGEDGERRIGKCTDFWLGGLWIPNLSK
jgi:hypothetical protein